MHDGYLLDKVKDDLSEDDFVTSFHRRVFKAISNVLEKTSEFDITLLSGDFSPSEMGRIVQISTASFVYKNAEEQLLDCISVLKEEKNKVKVVDTDNLNNDDFASLIDKIGKNKK